MFINLIQPTAVRTPYPQHARNYMDQEPKLPTPQIDAMKVAEKKAAKYVGKQQYDEAPRNPKGALYVPGGTGKIYGSGGQMRH